MLLINPWIYDFAAYNFWARPLGLLKVAEFLTQFNVKISFIDCCDSYRIKKFGTGKYTHEVIEKPELLSTIPRKYKRYGIKYEEFIERLKNLSRVDLILVTSIMSYWWQGLRDVVTIVRECFKNIPIILGGIYATLYEEHAKEMISPDFVYKGVISDKFVEVLDSFGIKIERVRDKPLFWWNLNFYKTMPYAPILTSTGCPYRCSYCASSILYGSFNQREVDEVIGEIEELYKIGVRDFAFYDDALLYRAEEHIKPILRRVEKIGTDLRFHTPNGLHARFIDEEIASLMKRAGFKTIRLSLETVNIRRQLETGGKVTNEDLERAVLYLKRVGFSGKEIGVYIMYGLPGQDLREVFEGVNFLRKLQVRIHLTEFSPIRGTYYWNRLVEEGKISDNLDPILTNNTVFSELFGGYKREEIERLKIEVNKFNQLI